MAYYRENAYIGTLYSPGYSSIMMSYFRAYLTLDFAPWLRSDNKVITKYDLTNHRSTSVNSEGAKYFYLIALSILNGENAEKPINAILPCNNNTTLTFEYKPDENNQLTAYLTINKEKATIPFRFQIRQYKVRENDQIVTKVIQSGLGSFAKTLLGYIVEMGVDDNLTKLPANFNEDQPYSEQIPSPTWNN